MTLKTLTGIVKTKELQEATSVCIGHEAERVRSKEEEIKVNAKH